MSTEEDNAAARQQKRIEDRLRDLNDEKEALSDVSEQLDNKLAIMREELKLLKLTEPLSDTALIAKRASVKLLIEENKAKKDSIEAGKKIAEDLGGLLGLNKNFEDSMMGSVVAMLAQTEGSKKLAEQLRKTFSMENIAYSLTLKMTQATFGLATAQDSSLASFNKQTGAARTYGTELVALESEMYRHGVTSEDAAEAMGALVKNVHALKQMSSSARENLVKSTAVLQELGVSADTTGANVQFMTRSLGVSVTAATKYQRELFTLAQEIGMPPAEMAEGFKAAAPKLAAFGKQAGKVFKTLAVNARAAGMEVEQMLGIVEQFDTFEGAAQSVGQLNALLGGQFLNSMELVMETDPTERMRMLSGALNEAGKSFDQMTYYEKKSIAAAAGLSDVNELALVMAGSFSGAATGAGKTQAEIEKLAEQTREMNDIGEEFNQLIRMFAVEMRPLIVILKDTMEGIQTWGASMKWIMPIITGVAVALGTLKLALQAVAAQAMSVGTAFKSASLLGLFVTMLTVFTMLSPQGKAVAAVLAVITIGMYALAGGITAANIASGGIVFALATLATALSYLIYLFFEKQLASNFLEGLVKVGQAFVDIGTGLLLSASGFYAVIPAVLALLALTPALAMSVLPGGAFWTLSTGLGWISDAVERMDTEKLGALTSLFGKLSDITGEAADNINEMGVGMEKIGVGMLMMSTAMANPLMALALAPLLAGNVLGAATDAATGTTYSSDSPKGLSKKSGKGTAGTTPAPKSPAQDHTITLKFDNRGFETRVIEIMDGQLNANQG